MTWMIWGYPHDLGNHMPLYNQNHNDFSRGVFHRSPHHWALCVASPAKIYGDTQRSWGIRIMSDTDNWIILMVQHTHTKKKSHSCHNSGLNPNMPEPGSANRALTFFRALQHMDIFSILFPWGRH